MGRRTPRPGNRTELVRIARMHAHKSAIVILIARITPGLSYLIPLFLLLLATLRAS